MKKFWMSIFAAGIIMFIGVESSALTVKGQVVCGGNRLPDVILTDGYSFTKTKRNGGFKMELADSARFVYILTPSGYVADWSSGVPQFYHKVDGRSRYVFNLTKTQDPSSLYNLIAVADPQPSKPAHCDEFDGTPLDDICRTVSQLEGLTVGLVLGDVSFNKYHLMDRWKKSIVRTGIPFYAVPGNHDHFHEIESDRKSVEVYTDKFGPENYAFFIGNDAVIMLDNIIYGLKTKSHEYTLGYTDQQLQWLSELMKYIPADADIYVGQHSPTNGRFYTYGGSETKLIVNGQAFLDILKGHKVTIISGHNHLNKNFRYTPDVVEHNVAAICGTWWDAYHCKDGTPRGYKVYTDKEGSLSWYYKSVGKDKDFQYELFRPGEAQLNPESILLNLWDYDENWTVEWLEDGNFKGTMTRVHELNHLHRAEVEATFARKGRAVPKFKRTAKSNHYFAATPSEGAAKITIVIKNPFGKQWVEEISL